MSSKSLHSHSMEPTMSIDALDEMPHPLNAPYTPSQDDIDVDEVAQMEDDDEAPVSPSESSSSHSTHASHSSQAPLLRNTSSHSTKAHPILTRAPSTNTRYIEELRIMNEVSNDSPRLEEDMPPILTTPIIIRQNDAFDESDTDDSDSSQSSRTETDVLHPNNFTKTEVTPFGAAEAVDGEELSKAVFARPAVPQLPPMSTPVHDDSFILMPNNPNLDSPHKSATTRGVPSKMPPSLPQKSSLIPHLQAPLLPSVSSNHNSVTQEYDNIYLERAYLKYLYFINDDSIFGRNWFRVLLMSLIWMLYIATDVVSAFDFSKGFEVKLQKVDTVFYIRLSLRVACFVLHWLLAATLFVLEVIVKQAEQRKKRNELMGEMNSFGEALSTASTFGQKKSAKEILELKKSISGKNLQSLKSLRKMSDATKSQLFGITELTTKQLRVALRILDWLLMLFITAYYLCAGSILQMRFHYPEQFYYRADALIFTLVLIVVPRVQIRMYLLTVWVLLLVMSTMSILYFVFGLVQTTSFNIVISISSVVVYCVFFLWMVLQFYMMEKVRRSRFWNQFWRNEERILHEKEKNRYNQLMRNIVPYRFSKHELHNHARFVSVAKNKTIIISNLVDFTSFTEGKSSRDIFSTLSELYDCFDSLAFMFSVSKVKTCGDLYFGLCLHQSSGSPELIASTFGYLMVEAVQKMCGKSVANQSATSIAESDSHEDTLHIHVAITTGEVGISTIGENLITFDVYGQPVQDALQILKEKRSNTVQISSAVATKVASHFSCQETTDALSTSTWFQTFTLKEPTSHGDILVNKAYPIVQRVRKLKKILSDNVVNPYNVSVENLRSNLLPMKSSPLNSPKKTNSFITAQQQKPSAIAKFGGTQKTLTNEEMMPFYEDDTTNSDTVLLLNEINVQTRFDKEFDVRFLDKIKQRILPNDYSKYLSKVLLTFCNGHLLKQFTRDQYKELKTFTKLTFALVFVLSAAQMSMLTATYPEHRTEGAHIVQYVMVAVTFLLAVTFLIPGWANRFVVGQVYSMVIAFLFTLLPVSLIMLPAAKLDFTLEVSVIFSLAVLNGLHLIHHWIRQILSTVLVVYVFISTPFFSESLRIDQYFNVAFAFILLSVFSYRFSSQLLRLFALQHDLAREEKVHETAFKNSKYLIYSVIPERIIEKLQDEDGVVSETLKNGAVLLLEVCNLDSQQGLVDVVYILNELYTTFDRIINESDCVKLKSFNFTYSAFCFSKNKKNHKHAATMCRCAMAMVDASKTILHKHDTNAFVRVGLQVTDPHLGYIRGGVVGKISHSYEIVGNVMRYARHLAHTSQPNKIQVDQYTNTYLESTYDMEMRGEITLNGLVGAVHIGDQQVQTYFVLQKHTLATLDMDDGVGAGVGGFEEEVGDDAGSELQELWPI